MRVPLIFPTAVVIARLDVPTTRSQDPPGSAHDEGYDDILREPIIYKHAVTGDRTSPRQELASITIPCQPENATVEELNLVATGNDPMTDAVFVLHRRNLKKLGLIDASTGLCLLKYGDRIVSLTKRSRVVRTWLKPLYICQVLPRSHGFGPDGYDLEIVYTTHRYTTG